MSTASIPAKPRGLTPAQYDVAISQLTRDIESYLEAGEDGEIPIVVSLVEALRQQKAEYVDATVRFLLWLEGQRIAATTLAKVYQDQAAKAAALLSKIRSGLQQYIDGNLPPDNRRLTGATSKIYTQRSSQASLEILDEAAVPKQFYAYEIIVRIPAFSENVDASLQAVQDFARGLGAASEVKSSAGQPKMILDMERVQQHLSHNSEPWGRYGYGRHLRTKPAMSEVAKALKPVAEVPGFTAPASIAALATKRIGEATEDARVWKAYELELRDLASKLGRGEEAINDALATCRTIEDLKIMCDRWRMAARETKRIRTSKSINPV